VECVLTPGHTDGTMSFFFDVYEGDKKYRAGMFGGAGTNTMKRDFLIERGLPFDCRDKFAASINRLLQEKVDVMLGNHVDNNDTVGNLEKMKTSSHNPFINSERWYNFLNYRKERLLKTIEEDGR